MATATYAFILCWSEYLFALAFLTRTDMKTMPLALYRFSASTPRRLWRRPR